MSTTTELRALPASDLFSDDLRSAPPRIVTLRKAYDEASEAYRAASEHEDESGEAIPIHIHKAYIRATDRLRAEEARVATLVASENAKVQP